MTDMVEHFHPTQRTWINQQLDTGDDGLYAVHTHIVEIYTLPLEVYFRGTSWFRSYGEDPDWAPEVVVHEFFADRLGKADYLRKWLDTGLKLRKWLINGLHLFLKEYYRRIGPLGTCNFDFNEIPVEQEPGIEADRIMVCGLVRQAIKKVVLQLEADGQDGHARAFVSVYLYQDSHAQVSKSLGCTVGQVKGMLRLARIRFREAFCQILQRDGASVRGLDDEIQTILEVIQS